MPRRLYQKSGNAEVIVWGYHKWNIREVKQSAKKWKQQKLWFIHGKPATDFFGCSVVKRVGNFEKFWKVSPKTDWRL